MRCRTARERERAGREAAGGGAVEGGGCGDELKERDDARRWKEWTKTSLR
jgi:hypothetical protein